MKNSEGWAKRDKIWAVALPLDKNLQKARGKLKQ